MSSNGTRKETRGWEISSTGQMVNISTDDVAIEELPPSGPIAVKAGGTPPPVPYAPPKKTNDVITDAMAMLDRPPRPRKSTLDAFNDEMAVLDRPLEGDVEYAEEAPRPSRMRGVALFAGIVLGMGLGGGVILSRRHAAPPPSAQAVQPAMPTPATAAAPPAAAPTVLAAQVAPTPGAPAAEAATAPAADEDDAANEDAAPAPGSHAAWGKVKGKTGHGKASRAASGKSSHHRSASKRTVSAKHSSSRHH
jgi:hypothetical protein